MLFTYAREKISGSNRQSLLSNNARSNRQAVPDCPTGLTCEMLKTLQNTQNELQDKKREAIHN